ncbi:recombinase family protein [Azospirillum humicireducens]|uniref:Recombinase family protein n=1 Tax=Azospirillum humicireducens TaxID=1226968 RepID=A0A160JDM6_9PROT|nr:recombinase family protein [Azospirillum humicireducens]ANC90824.2 recombinase family protein [Azospirillum humicireducens]ANC90835.2 recombinase family protein [Azospirillum humicireducens]
MGRIYGYSRVSTSEQDWALQLDALLKRGVDDRDIFKEKASGARRDREELRRVLDLLRPGDELVVWRLDRLARSQIHLLQIVEEVEGRGAKLVSVMDQIDTSTATGRMILGVLATLAEFERNLIRERSQAGVAVARQRGVKFGRPSKVTAAVVRQIMLASDAGTPVAETCRTLGISRSSYYMALRSAKAASIGELAVAA